MRCELSDCSLFKKLSLIFENEDVRESDKLLKCVIKGGRVFFDAGNFAKINDSETIIYWKEAIFCDIQ